MGARNVFVKALGAIRDRSKFSLVGYVVMPEHVPLLLSEPPKSTPSIVLKVLKQRVARDLLTKKRKARNDQLRLAFMTGDAGLAAFLAATLP
jgi:REP element-mobilizing transposase RayT